MIVLNGVGQHLLRLVGQVRQSGHPEYVNHVLPWDFHRSHRPSAQVPASVECGWAPNTMKRYASAATAE